VLHQIGTVHYLREDHSAALECYQRSAAISEELGERAIAIATRIQIANILYHLGEEDDALRNYHDVVECLSHAAPERNASLIGAVLVQIGQIHQKARRHLEAETRFREAEVIVRRANDRRSLIKVLRARALISRERREYDEACETYAEATRVAAELGDIVEAVTCSLLVGDLEKDRVQLGEAIAHYAVAHALLETAPAARVVSVEQRRALTALLDERLDELERTMGAQAFSRIKAKHWDRD